MSKNIERCPKDIKKLVNPKTGRCVMESSPIIKKLIQEGYTVVVTPDLNQPSPPPSMPDVKVFKVCPKDIKKLVNPTTGRCINNTSPIVKKLMEQGWSIAFNDNPNPLVIKPKDKLNYKKLKKDLDTDEDGIISINEYLASRIITKAEENTRLGNFYFLRTNTNIPEFLRLAREKDEVLKNNLCWFEQRYFTFIGPTYEGRAQNIKEYISVELIKWRDSNLRKLYITSQQAIHASLYEAPVSAEAAEAFGISISNNSQLEINPSLRGALISCKERFLAMALTLSTSSIFSGESLNGHANVIFFDTVNKTIDRYDPHGVHCVANTCPSYDQDKTDKILKDKFRTILPDYRFIDFTATCPNIGPQAKAEIGTRNGYCVTWSLMFTILRLLNPDKTVNQLNSVMLQGTPSQMMTKMQKFAKFYSDILKKRK